jgi:glycosyltransferase involved in cell wall biosynthesis
MNVMFLSNLYPPNEIGGYERICFDVVETMVERGHEVVVLTSSYGGREAEYAGQTIDRGMFLFATEGDVYIPFVMSDDERLHKMQENKAHLERALATFTPDVLFVWNLFFFDPSILDVVRSAPCKVVYLLTDNWLITFLNPSFMASYFTDFVHRVPRWDSRIGSRLRRWGTGWRRKLHHERGYAVFPSLFMRDLHAQAGITFDGTTIVHHGVNLKPGDPSKRTFKHLDQSSEAVRLLYAGRVVDIKGIHTIIEALPRIVTEMSPVPVELHVVGDRQDERYSATLNERIDELNMASKVRFSPPVKRENMPELLAEHDVYLLPSLYEPFSIALIEALASGIPTVASDAGGNREIVFHGTTGLIHTAGDPAGLARCTLKLLRSPGLRQKVSCGGRRIGLEHTLGRMVDKIEDYLRL